MIRPGTYLTIYLDTDPSNPGPEYRNDLVPASELSPLMRIEKFGRGRAPPSHVTVCAAAVTSTDPRRSPSRCRAAVVGYPDKVRVSVRGYFDVKGPNVVDWAPGFKKLGRLGPPLSRPIPPPDSRWPSRAIGVAAAAIRAGRAP